MDTTFTMSFNHSLQKIKFMKIAALAGRLLFSLVFLISGLTLFSAADIGYAASQGVPWQVCLSPFRGPFHFGRSEHLVRL